MSLTASRMLKEQHPPLCRALKTVMTVTGTTGVELARLLDRSQSAVARYYADREPDFAMTVEIEKALGLPGGTLFALAGYTASSHEVDALAALASDETLTDAQKQHVVFILLDALREHGSYAAPGDTMKAVSADPRIAPTRKRMLAQVIGAYREENVARGKAARRPLAKKR